MATQQETITRKNNPYAEGTRAHELYNSNPYTDEKFVRQQTGWDRAANLFGLRSNYDAALEDWRRAELEYDAQVAQIKGEDEYNSDAAKVERMQAAGLNPDLLGTSGASEAAEFAQEQGSPDTNAVSEDTQAIFGILSEIPKILTFGASFTQDMAKNIGAYYDVKQKKQDWTKRLSDLAGNFIDNFAVDSDFQTDYGKSTNYHNYSTLSNQIVKDARTWATQNGFNKRDAQKFGDNVYNMVNGNKKGELYKRWTDTLVARNEFGKTRKSQFTIQGGNNEDIMEAVGTLTQEMDTILANTTGARVHESMNKLIYESERDPTLEAEARRAEDKNTKDSREIIEEARKAIKKTTDSLDKYVQQGDFLAIALTSALAGLQLKYLEK